MRTKSPEKVELPKKVVKLLEEAYIVCLGLGTESAEVFSKNFQKESPLIHLTTLLLAAIDDAQKPRSVTIESLFRTARLTRYLKKAEELLKKNS